jgi:hypothetical protein
MSFGPERGRDGEPNVRWTGVVVSFLLLAAPGYGLAHHSIAAMYDRDKAISVDGRLVRIEIINPHSALEVEARGRDGRSAVWRFESSGSSGMQRTGVEPGTLKIGEHVRMVGYPARSGGHAAWLTRLETPDRVYDFSFRRSSPAPTPVSVN